MAGRGYGGFTTLSC